MAREIIMGIDVGTHAVKTIIAESGENERTPRVIGTGLSPVLGIRRGFIINPLDVSHAIKNSVKSAQEKTGLRIKEAFISIGGAGVEGIRSKGSIVVSRADNEITENDVKRAVAQSETQLLRNLSSYMLNRDILENYPLSYKIDEEIIAGNPASMKGEKLEVETLFLTAPSQHLVNLLKSMELAGVTIEDIVPEPIAISRILLSPKEKEIGCVLINIGGDNSSIAVFEEGNPVSAEMLPIGSNHITFDISRAFQTLLEEAEQMKLCYGEDQSCRKKLANIIEPRLNDIFELVDSHLSKIKRSGLLPAGAILTGGGTNLMGIEEIAKKILCIPSQLSHQKIELPEIANDPAWVVALGLCHGAFNKNGSIKKSKGVLSKTKNTAKKIFKLFIP